MTKLSSTSCAPRTTRQARTMRDRAASPVYVLIAAASLVMAACQPAEGPAERAGKAVDNAATTAGDKAAEAGKSVKDGTENAVDAAKEKAKEAKQ